MSPAPPATTLEDLWRRYKRWPYPFIALWLAVQLLLPLHYYLLRRDDHDERFAWRMFSPMRMLDCDVEMTVDEKPIAITAEFHDAWEKIARRGRRSVIEAMGARLCKKYPGKPVRARLTCHPLKRPEYYVGGFDLCTIPSL